MQQARQGAPAASGARYGLFFSFDRGVGVLPQTLAQRLGERVRTGVRVTGVRATSLAGHDGWTLVTSEGELRADAIILAMPAWRAAELVGDFAFADRLKAIHYGSAATATFAFPRSRVPHPLDASGFVVPSVENQLVLASTWASEKWPGRAPPDRVLIRVFLGGNGRDEVPERSDEELARIARDGLRKWMGIEVARS